MQYLSPLCFINKSLCLAWWVTGVFWIKSWFSSFPFSFPSPRSFPSLSLCQKSTANSKSSSTLVWNTLKTYTSGTPAPRLSAFGLNLLIQVHAQWVLKFQTFWSSGCYVLSYPCSPITDFLPFFLSSFHHSCKQTNRLSLADSFQSDKGPLSHYNWHTQANATLQYGNQGRFLFHIPLRLNNLIKVCVFICVCIGYGWWKN